jgi:hypothetical protein
MRAGGAQRNRRRVGSSFRNRSMTWRPESSGIPSTPLVCLSARSRSAGSRSPSRAPGRCA